jgi:hypothetical protein
VARNEQERVVRGSVRHVAAEESLVVDGLRTMTSGCDAQKIFVLNQGAQPSDNSQFNRTIGWCCCAISVVGLVPPGVWTVRRWRRPPAEKPGQGSVP